MSSYCKFLMVCRENSSNVEKCRVLKISDGPSMEVIGGVLGVVVEVLGAVWGWVEVFGAVWGWMRVFWAGSGWVELFRAGAHHLDITWRYPTRNDEFCRSR